MISGHNHAKLGRIPHRIAKLHNASNDRRNAPAPSNSVMITAAQNVKVGRRCTLMSSESPSVDPSNTRGGAVATAAASAGAT